MSFATLNDVALYLNKMDASELNPLETAQLSALIVQVDGIIKNYCGWNIFATDYVDAKLNGNGKNSMSLEAYPLISVTSVVDTTSGSDITSVVDISNTEGYLTTNDSSTTFSAGTDNIVATYRAGFEADVIPAELTYAATYLVIINYKKIRSEMFGVAKGKVDAVEVEFESSNLPTLVQNVLNKYRLIAIR